MRRICATLISGCCLAVATAGAQERAVLDPVIVTTPRLDAHLHEMPAALSVLELPLLQPAAQDLTLDESLSRVPGVFAHNQYNFAQGVRLSIRGFGARAAFGIRGVRVLVDGLPLTLPDGQTQLDGLDLTLADRIEVVRGPFAAAYGNASGGVVQIVTQEGGAEPQAVLRGQLGAYRLREGGLRGGGEWRNWNLFGGVRALRLDGYRAHSEVELYTAYGKIRRSFNDSASLTTVVNVSEREAQDPGALTRQEWRSDRRQAAPNNLRFDGWDRASQQRIGWVFRDSMSDGDILTASAYVGRRDFANRLPFAAGGQVEFERLFGGVGLQYSLQRGLFSHDNRLAFGVDIHHQRDDRQNYNQAPGGVRGELVLDQVETAVAAGLYAESQLRLARAWRMTLGARYDNVRLEVEDNVAVQSDASGSRTLEQWSWLVGLSYGFAAGHHLYANAATVFETPTTSELANPAGRGFNPDLDAQTAVNYELGVKGVLGAGVDYSVALFVIRLDDELVPYELGGRNYFENAGRSRREGLELGVDWWIADPLRVSLAYTYADFRFERFRREVDGEIVADYGGNRIPGIPRQHGFAELAWDGQRWFWSLDGRYAAGMYADNANEERVGSYLITNLRLGRRLNVLGGQWELFAGINNLLDRNYPANVRINAREGRYYEPAPERHWFAGLEGRF